MSNSSRRPLRKLPDDVLAVVGGGLDKSSVCLRFAGDDLDPGEVTRLLGARPTSQWQKGDIVGEQSDRISTSGQWALAVPPARDRTLESQLVDLFDQLTSDLSVWRDLTQRFRADVFCGLFLEEWNRGFELSPSILGTVAARNLKIGFDIYCDC